MMPPKSVIPSNNASSKLHQHSGRGRRGRRSSLERLPDTPLDVVFEIFSHLTPQELLHLGRSTKTLRALIFSKRSSFLWKAAREQVEDLPPLPPFLSEPQYANLMFDHYCLNCLKPNVKGVIWKFLARYCNACRYTMTTEDHIKGDLELLAHSRPTPLLVNPLPFVLMRIVVESRRMMVARFHDRDVTKLRAALKGAANTEQKFKIIEDRQKLTAEIENFGYLCQQWINNMKIIRSREIAVTKRRRYEAIVERLTTMGRGEDIRYMQQNGLSRRLRSHTLVKQPKDLTDRAWEKIRPNILVVMDGIQSERLAASRKKVLGIRFKMLKKLTNIYRRHGYLKGAGGLNSATIAYYPEVQAVIDISPTTELTVIDIHNQLGPQMPKLVARWRAKMGSELSAHVLSAVKVPEHISPLDLAIAVFKCDRCQKYQRFPDILDDGCDNGWLLSQFNPPPGTDLLYSSQANLILGSPRSNSHYSLAKCATSVIKMMGKDPTITTATDMDELDAKLICLNVRSACQRGMTWRTAINHWDHWYFLQVEDRFHCLHCSFGSLESDVISHLQGSHQISAPSLDVDYRINDSFKVSSEGELMALSATWGYPIVMDLSFEEQFALMGQPFANQVGFRWCG